MPRRPKYAQKRFVLDFASIVNDDGVRLQATITDELGGVSRCILSAEDCRVLEGQFAQARRSLIDSANY